MIIITTSRENDCRSGNKMREKTVLVGLKDAAGHKKRMSEWNAKDIFACIRYTKSLITELILTNYLALFRECLSVQKGQNGRKEKRQVSCSSCEVMRNK